MPTLPAIPKTRRRVLAAALAVPFAARAQGWPAKPLRVIIPGPAGGPIDIAGRAVGDAMQKELGQPWLIDPRPGANGILAGQLFLGSPADGYTLYLTVSSGHVALNLLMKAPFDAMADFKPIAMIGTSTALLCVPPSSPAATIGEFVAYARANSGRLNYLNPGNGTGPHLLAEMLKIRYGLDMTSVYYKGFPPGVQDLLAGRIDFGSVTTPLVIQHVKAGRLKAIGLVGPKRLADLPDVATLAEQGFGDIELRASFPLYGHKTLPDGIADRLNEAMRRALGDTETATRLAASYIEPLAYSRSETAEALVREHERLANIIRQLGIKADGS